MIYGYAFFHPYSQANILKPLGMNSTSFLLTPNLASRLTLPIAWRNPSTSKIQPDIPSDAGFYTRYGAIPPASPPIQRGGGGLLSTTHDYTLLLTHLLRLSPTSFISLPDGEERLLSEESWKKMFQGSFTDARAIEDLSIHKPGDHGPRSGDQQWSVGGLCLNLKDWEGRRKAGSGYCESNFRSVDSFQPRRVLPSFLLLTLDTSFPSSQGLASPTSSSS